MMKNTKITDNQKKKYRGLYAENITVNVVFILASVIFDFLLIGTANKNFQNSIIKTFIVVAIIEFSIVFIANMILLYQHTKTYYKNLSADTKKLKKKEIKRKITVLIAFFIFCALFVSYGIYAVRTQNYFLFNSGFAIQIPHN